MEYEKFFAKAWKAGNSIVVTIPSNLILGLGIKEGDTFKLMLKKEAGLNGENK